MRRIHWLWRPYSEATAELAAALESVMDSGRRSWTSIAVILAATLAAWFVYVPAHELLHAVGCLATGGRVDLLQIAPRYGGRLLERIVPFVRSEGEHAGRLASFDTGGSDLTYLATDFAPYLLTILGAVPLLRLARRRRSALLFGPGCILAAAPLVSLPGDYFEMAGILTSRALTAVSLGTSHAAALRSDDLVALLAEFPARFPEQPAAWGLAVLGTLVVACLLAGATLAAALRLGRRLMREAGAAPGSASAHGP